jgi:hypothetical protein
MIPICSTFTSCASAAGWCSSKTRPTACAASWRRSSNRPIHFRQPHRLKVLEQSAGQLAQAFKQGALYTLDDGPLFERALAAVIGKLRQLNRGK